MRSFRLALLVVAAAAALAGTFQRELIADPPAAPAKPLQPCPEAAVPGLIAEPIAWARECLCGGPISAPAEPCALDHFEKDLDLDGTAELLLATAEDCGNAGCPYLVFAPATDGFHYRGSLFLHRLAVRVLPATGNEPIRIMAYVRRGPAEGVLRTIVHDGTRFVTVAEETIEPSGKDRERYERLFSIPVDENAGASAGAHEHPNGLPPAHPDEAVETTLHQRFSLDQALASAVTVRAALASFEELTTEVRGRVPKSRLEAIGNTDPEMQTIGFHNLPGTIEGALRLQEWTIRKLRWELAVERRCDGRSTDAEVREARQAFEAADQAFRHFWSELGIAD